MAVATARKRPPHAPAAAHSRRFGLHSRAGCGCAQSKLLTDPKHKKLLAKLKKPSVSSAPAGTSSAGGRGSISPPVDGLTDDDKIEATLDTVDEGIGEKLKDFEGEQAVGEKLNEVAEKYYKTHPRSFDDQWCDSPRKINR